MIRGLFTARQYFRLTSHPSPVTCHRFYHARCPMKWLLLLFLLPATALALDNEYVRVTRNAATCPEANMPGCGDRVIVALGDI
jgi:hypothetical protein